MNKNKMIKRILFVLMLFCIILAVAIIDVDSSSAIKLFAYSLLIAYFIITDITSVIE